MVATRRGRCAIPTSWGLVALLGAGCATTAQVELAAEPWPAADRLFRQDARWRGGDDAYSVALGGGRVLWLFGDSFVARQPGQGRRDAVMVRNSVGLQQGADPTTASISFHYHEATPGAPSSFFAEPSATEWYWPGDGELVDGQLVLFLMRVRRAQGGLGFEVFGSTVVRVRDVSQGPDSWTPEPLGQVAAPAGVIVGSATVMVHGDHLLAYSASETEQGHPIYLARLERKALAAGTLRASWYDGQGWGTAQAARPVFQGGQTELTVHARGAGRLVTIQTIGFGGTDVGLRTALAPEGPWSAARAFYRPADSERDGLLVYAAKAHPELVGAELVLTYVANATDVQRLLDDDSIYYPRFLRARWR